MSLEPSKCPGSPGVKYNFQPVLFDSALSEEWGVPYLGKDNWAKMSKRIMGLDVFLKMPTKSRIGIFFSNKILLTGAKDKSQNSLLKYFYGNYSLQFACNAATHQKSAGDKSFSSPYPFICGSRDSAPLSRVLLRLSGRAALRTYRHRQADPCALRFHFAHHFHSIVSLNCNNATPNPHRSVHSRPNAGKNKSNAAHEGQLRNKNSHAITTQEIDVRFDAASKCRSQPVIFNAVAPPGWRVFSLSARLYKVTTIDDKSPLLSM